MLKQDKGSPSSSRSIIQFPDSADISTRTRGTPGVFRGVQEALAEGLLTDDRVFHAALELHRPVPDLFGLGNTSSMGMLHLSPSGVLLSYVLIGLKQGMEAGRPIRAALHENSHVLFRSTALLKFSHDLIQVEAGRLLPLRIVLERGQELANIGLCRHQQEDVIN